MTIEHGRTGYTRRCRCAACKAAERDYQRTRYRRKRGLPVDPPAPWAPVGSAQQFRVPFGGHVRFPFGDTTLQLVLVRRSHLRSGNRYLADFLMAQHQGFEEYRLAS